jgi:hypothetical protein
MGQKPAVILYCQSDKQSNPNEKPSIQNLRKPDPIQTKNQVSKIYENPIQSKRKTKHPNLPKTTGNPILKTSKFSIKPENIAPLLRGIFLSD